MGYHLDPVNDKWFTAQPLTVVIYWRKRGGPDALQNGHAALIIDSQRFSVADSDYYVSWLAKPGSNVFKQAGDASNFWADMGDWGGIENPNNNAKLQGRYFPTRWVAISGLHIGNMKDTWDEIRTKQGAHWKLLDKNCATVVARVLKAGAGDRLATKAKNQLVWWPTDLITYARSMGSAVIRDSNDPPGNANG